MLGAIYSTAEAQGSLDTLLQNIVLKPASAQPNTQAVAQVSKTTAARHLSELVARNCLQRLPGGGRNTRYQINPSGRALPSFDTE